LCDTISVEQLNSLSALQYDTAQSFIGDSCTFEAAPGQSGSHALTLYLSGFSFDMMRSSPGVSEVMVGERTAIVFEGDLHVGLDEGILSVIPDFAGSEVAQGLDRIEYAIDVAEVVVPALEAMSTGSEEPSSEGSLAPPPQLDGMSWRSQGPMPGEELVGSSDEQRALWQALLDAAGADASQLSVIDASGTTESGERFGTYAAIRIVGLDGAQLSSVLLDWLRSTSGEDIASEELTLDGRSVSRLSVGGEIRGYVYVAGDVAHALTMSEENAAHMLEVLP
jgi:hypothetical protein